MPPAHPSPVQYGHQGTPHQGSDAGTVPTLCTGGWPPCTERPQITGIFSPWMFSVADSCLLLPLEQASCPHPHLNSCPVQAGLLGDNSEGICFLSLQRGWVPWLTLSGPRSVFSKTSSVIPEVIQRGNLLSLSKDCHRSTGDNKFPGSQWK